MRTLHESDDRRAEKYAPSKKEPEYAPMDSFQSTPGFYISRDGAKKIPIQFVFRDLLGNVHTHVPGSSQKGDDAFVKMATRKGCKLIPRHERREIMRSERARSKLVAAANRKANYPSGSGTDSQELGEVRAG